jgi:hypothetical protein
MKRENDLILFFLFFRHGKNKQEGGKTTRGNDSRAPPPHSHELNAKNEKCVALVAALNDVRASVHHLFLPCCALV